MDIKELAENILINKIRKHINFIDSQCSRKFDNKVDIVRFSLTDRQFNVIRKAFNLKQTQVLCGRDEISDFRFCNYTIKTFFNDRMNVYELRAKHDDFIEDYDEQLDYMESF